MNHVVLTNQTHPLRQPLQAAWCDSFICRLKGLMFRPSLAPVDGLVMVQPAENRVDAAIHMLFMNFDIAVIWLDRSQVVVDKALARRWRLAYSPHKAAKYVIELHPSRLDEFTPGDRLDFSPCDD